MASELTILVASVGGIYDRVRIEDGAEDVVRNAATVPEMGVVYEGSSTG